MNIYHSLNDKEIKSLAQVSVTIPEYFGPGFRKVLEILALTSEKGYRQMIEIVKDYLPCDECQEHALGILNQIKEIKNPFEHCIAFHNAGNKFGGKKQYTPRERMIEILDQVDALEVF